MPVWSGTYVNRKGTDLWHAYGVIQGIWALKEGWGGEGRPCVTYYGVWHIPGEIFAPHATCAASYPGPA